MINILICGDLCPINSNEIVFSDGDPHKIFGHYLNVLQNADYIIANLEGPLTNHEKKIKKSGPNIKISPKCISGIHNSKINLLNLANNHIKDFETKGIYDTIRLCKKYKIDTLGAGDNIISASSPHIYSKNGKKIGFLSYTDNEYGTATKSSAGSNPFNIINATYDIRNLKKNTDKIILLLHDGKEYYPYPTPELQKICRFLVDQGADVIICQHSHIIGSEESYNNGKIFYGQGNFFFDYENRKSDQWKYGCMIQLTLKNDSFQCSRILFKQSFPGITKLDTDEHKYIVNYLSEIDKNTKDNAFIESEWNNYCNKLKNNYLNILKGNGKILRKFFSLFKLYKYLYSSSKLLYIHNVIRSRVHRETLLTILKNLNKAD